MCPSLLFALGFLLSSFSQQAPAPPPAAPASQNFQIAGIVVDALSGQPLSRAEVSIQSLTRANTGQTVTTGDDGRFLFDNVAPGHYPLTAQRRGYLQQAYKQHEFFSTAIIVGPNLDTSHLRFALPPDASISGQVLDEFNDPVRTSPVLLFQQGLQLGRHTTWQLMHMATDDRGHYRFGHLLPGTYFVAVSAQPWYAQHVTHQLIQQTDSSGIVSEQEMTNGEPELDLVYPITFFSNATDISEAVPITLHPGDAETADITLRPTPALHITVSYVPSGKPDAPENIWPQVSQQLIPGFQQQLGTTTVGQNRPGLLEIAGLPPGHLNLTLRSAHGDETSARSLSVQLAADASINMMSDSPRTLVLAEP
jgi:carboxypeptidase family protein